MDPPARPLGRHLHVASHSLGRKEVKKRKCIYLVGLPRLNALNHIIALFPILEAGNPRDSYWQDSCLLLASTGSLLAVLGVFGEWTYHPIFAFMFTWYSYNAHVSPPFCKGTFMLGQESDHITNYWVCQKVHSVLSKDVFFIFTKNFIEQHIH